MTKNVKIFNILLIVLKESVCYVIFMLCVHKIMDPNPTDVKLDMLRSKISYLDNEMYVKINTACMIIR